ncbi:MAG: 2,3-bisphosphoglycerate-independent phosphoglycerate mutase [Alphaproteobacteria bacterium]|nr:MAG: 2,3-bisphosphoglycerate-independent phosphoglycerate mutase [Alphaproteobacteria bacterium]TAF76795.1 MAG: 2,3-bisphosphoglycerate-independent phosphoglycerate mutase [Alphaproteobacteria bacterium]
MNSTPPTHNNAERTPPVLLCILDGWGARSDATHNAIAAAHIPNWDRLCAQGAYGEIQASEEYVGLPAKQMGNSEVGHMNIGAGRPPSQLFPRINEAVANNHLREAEALQDFITQMRASGGVCHLMGLYSDGGVHAHQEHIDALAHILAQEDIEVVLHVILDGRDTPPRSAHEHGYLDRALALVASHPHIHLGTIAGRYFTMDRDMKWDRVARGYGVMMHGAASGVCFHDARTALMQHYANDARGDEFFPPASAHDYAGMKPEDGILMCNFRPDRARQIMMAFTLPAWDIPFARPHCYGQRVLGMADYWAEDCPLQIPAIMPMERLSHTLGELVSLAGKRQLRIAETEKYNHVTYFMSGGNPCFEGEDRILIPSPNVATYDLQPEMSAFEVTDKLVEAIASQHYQLMIVNYANPDMVGHTGVFAAAVQAVEAVDVCLGRIMEAMKQVGGVLLVTADHGNVEMMQDSQGNPHTQHTIYPVPFVAFGAGAVQIRTEGTLADIAPTILELMGLPKASEMTGVSLMHPTGVYVAAHDMRLHYAI